MGSKWLGKLQDIWESYWFIPGLMAFLSIALSQLALDLDRSDFEVSWLSHRFFYTGSAEGARSILSSIAGSMIGTAGVVFSITMLTLALSSKQYGSQILRNFMTDRGSQLVLGTFISAFLYCLLVLRQLTGDGQNGEAFIPQFSIVLSVGFAMAGTAALIYFIHHTTRAIQPEQIIDRLDQDLKNGLSNLFPKNIGQSPDYSDLEVFKKNASQLRPEQAVYLFSDKEGYLRRVHPQSIIETARTHQCIVEILLVPGDFCQKGDLLARVWGTTLDKELQDALLGSCEIGLLRSPAQDLRYVFEQLVGVAVMTLSSSNQDPFTVFQVLNRIGSNLSLFLSREPPSRLRLDAQGELRILAGQLSHESILDLCLNPLRIYGNGRLDIAEKLLEIISKISSKTENDSVKIQLTQHARLIYQSVFQDGEFSYYKQRRLYKTFGQELA